MRKRLLRDSTHMSTEASNKKLVEIGQSLTERNNRTIPQKKEASQERRPKEEEKKQVPNLFLAEVN